MLHAICDICGNDCGKDALLLSVQPFQNLLTTGSGEGLVQENGKRRQFICCMTCARTGNIPTPDEVDAEEPQRVVRYQLKLNRHHGQPVVEDRTEPEQDGADGEIPLGQDDGEPKPPRGRAVVLDVGNSAPYEGHSSPAAVEDPEDEERSQSSLERALNGH